MDPRIVAVEENLVSFFRAAGRTAPLTPLDDTDLVGATSEVAFPMFNAVVGARLDPASAGERATAVVAAYVDRGRPFLWWVTPSYTFPELEAALAAAGMVCEDVPGMHRPLPEPVAAPLPAGTRIEEVDVRSDGESWIDTMVTAFAMPEWLDEPFGEVMRGLDPDRLVNLLATLDGRPVATGTAWLDGDTVGLYNIATLPQARGRGVGYAVTAALLDAGHRLGARQAVLHATESGRPVYERGGFETVCAVPQYLWLPQD